MKVLFINAVCGTGSTGRICAEQAEKLLAEGNEVKIAYGRSENVPEKLRKYAIRIGTDIDLKWHGVLTRLFDQHGFASKQSTKKFIKWAEEYNPDVLWLHNLHGYYINVELLFRWIKKKKNLQVKWTLHDCWAFTGHCAYFSMIGCEKWREQCERCPQKEKYPASLLYDCSKKNYQRKMKAFKGVNDLTIITPSKWLADLVKQSYLKEYNVEVVHNTIDKLIFKPTKGEFRKKYGLDNKTIVLGVAGQWDERKGLEDFRNLATKVDENIKIVLVGVTEEQERNLPKSCLVIRKTNNSQELAEIYTAADVFFNPTYEDNYPTVNLESEACGTPVVTYDVGGAKETIRDRRSMAIAIGDLNGLIKYINNIERRKNSE